MALQAGGPAGSVSKSGLATNGCLGQGKRPLGVAPTVLTEGRPGAAVVGFSAHAYP